MRRAGPRARSAVVLAVATTVANVLGYVLVLLLARSLPAASLGAAGALLNLVVIGMVLPLAVQLVVARAVASRPGVEDQDQDQDRERAAALPRAALRVALEVGCLLAVAVALASPLLGRFLHLGGPWAAVLAGVSFVPAAVVFAVQGLLQGAHRFTALSVVLVAAAAAKPVAGLVDAWLGAGVTGLMALLAAGTGVVAVASLVGIRAIRRAGRVPAAAVRQIAARLRPEVVSASVSTAGLLTFANIDLLLARHVLDPAASGAYTVGAIFAKGAFWAPQFVSTMLFPRMAQPERRASAVVGSVAVCSAAGAAAVLGTVALGTPLVRVVGGARYAWLGPTVWLFAALGGVLAVAQVLLYARLAVGDRLLGIAAWVCVAGLVVAVVTDPAPSTTGVVGRALAAAAAFVALGLLAERSALAAVVRARLSVRANGYPPVGLG
jgi:O-antigen/teichoic acid export membrane protein